MSLNLTSTSDEESESFNIGEIIIPSDEDDSSNEEPIIVMETDEESTDNVEIKGDKPKNKKENDIKNKSSEKLTTNKKKSKKEDKPSKELTTKGKTAKSKKQPIVVKNKTRKPTEKIPDELLIEYKRILLDICSPKNKTSFGNKPTKKENNKENIINLVNSIKENNNIKDFPDDFFKYYDVVKNPNENIFNKYFLSEIINNINIIKFNYKKYHLEENDYDKNLNWCYYSDVDITNKYPYIKIDMHSYCSLMIKLYRATYYDIYKARDNWINEIPNETKELLWKQAKENINKTKMKNNVITIFKSLINSSYVKLIFIYNYKENKIFNKMFKLFLTYKDYQKDLTNLFINELKPISWLFSLVHFSYRNITYDDDKNGFKKLSRDKTDNALFNPENLIMIGKLIENNYQIE